MRSSFGLSDRDLRQIEEILSRHPEVQELRLFGSRARGNFHPGSDIDLAIMDEGIGLRSLRQLRADFSESSLPYFVDLLLLAEVRDQGLRAAIEREGLPFYRRGSKLPLPAAQEAREVFTGGSGAS
jgi:predicted nucleotidyltransferase